MKKIAKQDLIIRIYMLTGLLLFICGIPLGIAIMMEDGHLKWDWIMAIMVVGCVISIITIVRRWDAFFTNIDVCEEGVLERRFLRRAVLVPWDEIETVKVGWIHTGIAEHHIYLNLIRRESENFKRSKVAVINGYDYHIALNKESLQLLKEHLPQRLKDMLGPNAFDY